MKSFAIVALLSLLAACSSTQSKPDLGDPESTRFGNSTSVGKLAVAGVTGTSLKIAFRKDGQWEKITSSGVADLKSQTTTGVEQAVVVATLRARAQIAELINSKISSKKIALTAISDDLEDPELSSKSQKVVESITQTSQAVLAGTVVESEYVDTDKNRVTVTVYVDRKTAAAAWSNR